MIHVRLFLWKVQSKTLPPSEIFCSAMCIDSWKQSKQIMSFSRQRREQRRPTADAQICDPHDIDKLRMLLSLIDSDPPTCAVLAKFMESEKQPKDFQRFFSDISSAWRSEGWSFTPSIVTPFCELCLFPWLFDCKYRFSHKAIVNIIASPTIKDNSDCISGVFKRSLLQHICFLKSVRDYMSLANFVDVLTVTVLPLFGESTFNDNTNDLLKLIPAFLHEPIVKATSRTSINSALLDDVRFCIRVSATYFHKLLSAIESWPQDQYDASRECLATVLHLSTSMLRSEALPKDVLNAAGLITASILCMIDNDKVLQHMCSQHELGFAVNHNEAAELVIASRFTAPAEGAFHLLDGCTNNGYLAFVKGLVSHCAAPTKGASSVNKLLLPKEAPMIQLLFKNVLTFASEQENPETRFMAIQALDHVAKYILCAADCIDTDPQTVSTSVFLALARDVCTYVYQIVTNLWDDPTQQVSGPLYHTYNTLLDISKCLTAKVPNHPALIDLCAAFRDALSVKAERRGKYHTLVALAHRMTFDQINTALVKSHDLPSGAMAVSTTIGKIVKCANNTKVSNICGDFLVVLAAKHHVASRDTFDENICAPLTEALIAPEVNRSTNISNNLARANIIAHMVVPLLKESSIAKDVFTSIICRILALPTSSIKIEVLADLLIRARNVSMSFEQHGSWSPAMAVCYDGVDAYSPSLRINVFGLNLLTVKASEPVTHTQCELALHVVTNYSQSGGDSTTRNECLSLMRKWLKRITDTVLSKNCTPEYLQLISDHFSKMDQQLSYYLSVDHTGTPFAAERRYFSLLMVEYLLDAFDLMRAKQVFGAKNLCSVVESTFSFLEDGWDSLRQSAFRVLRRIASLSHFPDADKLSVDASKHLTSPTYRHATAGALMMSLLIENTSADVELQPRQKLSKDAYSLQLILAKVETLQQIELVRPIHGNFLLMCTLLEYAEPLLTSTHIEQLVGRCIDVFSRCAAASDSENVDCRGHKFSGKEADDRVRVNNMWLGIRSACQLLECVFSKVPVSRVNASTCSNVCNSLVATLLATKHNGVMGKARQFLKTFCRLLLKSEINEYQMIPRAVIGFLLGEGGVCSPEISRILRRSQGLPHAIVPIIEAEDPALPLIIFPSTMSALLKTARVVGSKEIDIAHAVNALNVLKFIFDHSQFSTSVTPYSQDALILAASGFESPVWAMRNSSLMLFTSVLHRVVGDHPSKGGGGVTTSVYDLSNRLPIGLAFAVNKLVEAVSHNDEFAIRPALFPLLLLFSMLCPDPPHAIHAQKNEDVDIAALMRTIFSCVTHKNIMVRKASANAVVSVYPVEQLERLIKEYVSLLDENAKENTVHGVTEHLLRIQSHYIGTLRVDMKNRRSPHASAQLATSVNGALSHFFYCAALEQPRCFTVLADIFLFASNFLAVCEFDQCERILQVVTQAFHCRREENSADRELCYERFVTALIIACSRNVRFTYECPSSSTLARAAVRSLSCFIQNSSNRTFQTDEYLYSCCGPNAATSLSASLIANFNLHVVRESLEISALYMNGEKMLPPLLVADAFAIIRVFSTAAFPHVTADKTASIVASDENSSLRAQIMLLFNKCDKSESFTHEFAAALLFCADSSQVSDVRIAAVDVIGKRRCPYSLILLLKLLNDDEEIVRSKAASTLFPAFPLSQSKSSTLCVDLLLKLKLDNLHSEFLEHAILTHADVEDLDAEDDLFDEERDNIFWEDRLMNALVSQIQSRK